MTKKTNAPDDRAKNKKYTEQLARRKRRKEILRNRQLALLGAVIILVGGFFLIRSVLKNQFGSTREYILEHNLTSALPSGNNGNGNSTAPGTTTKGGNVTSEDANITLMTKSLSQILNGAEINDQLMLINGDRLLTEAYNPDLIEFDDGIKINPEVKDGFLKMLDATEAETGEVIYIISGYRNRNQQTKLNEKDNVYVQVPGGSEHESGLAIDLMVDDIGDLRFYNTPSGRYTNENSWKFGFIVRYPDGKEGITKIPFEPWHFRYVGFPHAQIIYENKFTMEEYIQSLEDWDYFSYGDYIVSMQAKTDTDKYNVPKDYQAVSVSDSNTGSYIFTFKKNPN